MEQEADPAIREVKQKLSSNMAEGDISPDAMKLWKERKVLKVVNGILIRKRICVGEPHSQLVLPSKYQESALSYVHNDMCHLGRAGPWSYSVSDTSGLACTNQLVILSPGVVDV